MYFISLGCNFDTINLWRQPHWSKCLQGAKVRKWTPIKKINCVATVAIYTPNRSTQSCTPKRYHFARFQIVTCHSRNAWPWSLSSSTRSSENIALPLLQTLFKYIVWIYSFLYSDSSNSHSIFVGHTSQCREAHNTAHVVMLWLSGGFQTQVDGSYKWQPSDYRLFVEYTYFLLHNFVDLCQWNSWGPTSIRKDYCQLSNCWRDAANCLSGAFAKIAQSEF
jgi:hypothetical protein